MDGVIGAGGMGVVIAAHHLALDKRVAIKLMRPELRARADLVRRFLREARAAARLNSRHATRVFDVGTFEDGTPYIVMEYLDGVDLGAWIRQRGTVPAALAAAIIVQAGDAIAEAHDAGIIHRDLKPANLFMTQDSRDGWHVKVLDLGICKLDEPLEGTSDTSLAGALGTPVYMAPEQLQSARRADARSDLWSLGVILYELVAGRVPFSGGTLAELRQRAACDPYPAMNQPGVPGDFESIIARCLEKDPRARFQRATDLVAALASNAAGMRAARPVKFPIEVRGTHWLRRWPLPAMGLAAAGLMAAGALALSSGGASTTSAARPDVAPRRGPEPALALPPETAPHAGSARHSDALPTPVQPQAPGLVRRSWTVSGPGGTAPLGLDATPRDESPPASALPTEPSRELSRRPAERSRTRPAPLRSASPAPPARALHASQDPVQQGSAEPGPARSVDPGSDVRSEPSAERPDEVRDGPVATDPDPLANPD